MKTIFVFGANELGKHGKGSALAASADHGAVYGQGFGPQGDSFGIPTCSKPTGMANHMISYDRLKYYVECFLLYAKLNPELEFKVTQIGCGLAGWKTGQVAPLFHKAPDNCLFDTAWQPWLRVGARYWGTF